jgi:hypothetical protein
VSVGDGERMGDGTRLIFWLDILILITIVILVILGKWDWVIAVVIGMVVVNYFDRWRSKRGM